MAEIVPGKTQGEPGKLQISAPDEAPQTFVLDKPVVRIGRLPLPENDLALTHGLVSRRHAQIYCDRDPYRIADLGSSNGTTVNDIPLPANEVRELHDGDVIALGPFTLRYEAPRAIEEPEAVDLEAVVPAGEEAAEQAPAREAEALEPDLLAALRLEEAPAPPAPPEPPRRGRVPSEDGYRPWVGMPRDRSRWLQYIPYIYSEHPFLGRCLLIFEDLFGPLDQIVGHFDLFLDPRTAPEGYLSTLAEWLGLVLDDRWPAERRRAILRSAVELYDYCGTKVGMTKLLEASMGCRVEIEEHAEGPHSFRVTIHQGRDQDIDEGMVRHLIDSNKPAHTVYQLEIGS
ncbi:MAG TPA: FHA domain-containing protein [Anaerolineae bacterium]|nr:FHA domain-containing protein [Anaerolineae bacterium]